MAAMGRPIMEADMNFRLIALAYIRDFRPQAQAELEWFRQQPTLESAIEHAALAINSNGKKYSHQWKLKKPSLEAARQILMMNSKAISQAKDFDDLFALVEGLCDRISGIGELYIYDTGLRIGAKLHLMPKKVYLHRGTRDGARALGFDTKIRALEISQIPLEICRLEPHEIEDVLCIFKDDLMGAASKYKKERLIKRGCCR
jgi:hypothetical protein